MIIQIVIAAICVAGAVLMFLIGYLVATRKSKVAVNEITEDNTSKLITLQKQNTALKEQLRSILTEQNQMHTAYKRIKSDTALHGEIFNRIKNSNETLSFNYVKLQKEFTRINNERASFLNRARTLETTLPDMAQYQKMQQEYAQILSEFETVQSTLSVQRLDNKSLLKTNGALTEDKQRLLTKLRKVFKEYKRLVSIILRLKKKTSELETLKTENEKITRAYEAAMENLKQLGHQSQILDDVENNNSDNAVKFEVLKTPPEDSESPHSVKEDSQAQNM